MIRSVGLLLALLPLHAAAVTLTVNSVADDTVAGNTLCTLREALANVDAASDTTGGDCVGGSGLGDTIVFNVPLPARINLRLGQLSIVSHDVTINGPVPGSPEMLRIDGRRRSRVFYTARNLTLRYVTIQHGRSYYGQGPIQDHSGGGLFVYGVAASARIEGCLFERNSSSPRYPTAAGGAISSHGDLSVVDSRFFRNRAGARINDGLGGAIIVVGVSTVEITGCWFEKNQTGSPGGGAIFNLGATLTVRDSLFARNRAAYGGVGGIVADGGMPDPSTTIINSTFYRNRGGALKLDFDASLTNCVLSDTGLVEAQGTLTTTNTIFGKGTSCQVNGGMFVSGGHNLTTDAACASGATDILTADPNLGQLRDNGGLTKTLALCQGANLPEPSCGAASAAIDAGDDAVTGPPLNLLTDQRGLPRQVGAHVDIGAFEVQ